MVNHRRGIVTAGVRMIVVALAVCPLAANAAMPYDAVCRVEAGGSGVLIYVAEGKGLVVTNAHVMPDKTWTMVYWPTNKTKRKAQVVAYHPEVDLCYMVIEKPTLAPAKMGIRDSHVVFTGFPWYDRDNLHWQYGNVTKETMTQVHFQNQPVPGMSGGAIFDRKDGDLCGITEAQKDGSKVIGLGVSDVALLLTAADYEDPTTWVPDGSHVEGYEPGDWVYAKPDKRRITRKYTNKAPHWKEKDEEPNPDAVAEPEPTIEYQLWRTPK